MTEVLPAMGYSAEQLADLEATINATDCRRRGHRHADRPRAPHQDRQADRARALRGGRHDHARHRRHRRRVPARLTALEGTRAS